MMEGSIAGMLKDKVTVRTSKTGKLLAIANVRATTGEGENLFAIVMAVDSAPCTTGAG